MQQKPCGARDRNRTGTPATNEAADFKKKHTNEKINE